MDARFTSRCNRFYKKNVVIDFFENYKYLQLPYTLAIDNNEQSHAASAQPFLCNSFIYRNEFFKRPIHSKSCNEQLRNEKIKQQQQQQSTHTKQCDLSSVSFESIATLYLDRISVKTKQNKYVFKQRDYYLVLVPKTK